jgi:hypothetical protein
MSAAILEWLDTGRVGASSKSIALAALGRVTKSAPFPWDGADFGRCYLLLQQCPEAKIGLDRLRDGGGPVWKMLVERWAEVEAAYLHDKTLGPRSSDYRCYDLIGSIILSVGERR